jgi:DNA topoisomerase-1
MPVVVVESPAKAKTINKYLGDDYTVLASFGHVRDLPPKDGSVDPDDDFAMKWEVAADSKKHLKAIKDALGSDDTLILATDPDREGEAISWHLLEALEPVLKKGAGQPRHLQRHHQGRRDRGHGQPARDRPAAGRCLSGPPRAGLSGRLQPVAGPVAQAAGREIRGPRAIGRLRLIVEREMEIEAFKAREYWSVHARWRHPARAMNSTPRNVSLGGKKLERSTFRPPKRRVLAVSAIDARDLKVAAVQARQPAIPGRPS